MTRFSDMTDREVMRLVQADDTEAFGVLYDRFAARALRVARALCTDAAAAQDAVQEGFLSMWRGRAQYHPDRAEVHAWVLGIVRNRAIDSLRSNGRHERGRNGSQAAAEALHAPGDVEADAVAQDDARRLQRLLAQLPGAQRDVVALAYFGELSHSEIARLLALPVGTVKGRMRLGLAKLREELLAG